MKPLQAFPVQTHEYDGQDNVLQYQEDGMTLRDYFAAKALSILCEMQFREKFSTDDIAKTAYELADDMLKAREAQTDTEGG